MNKNKHVLKLLLLMAFADKKYMQEEKDFIKSIAKKLEVSDDNLNQLINEIEQTKYVDQNELQLLFDAADNKSITIGPWFRLIKENFLNDIWDALDDLKEITDDKLHYMGDCE